MKSYWTREDLKELKQIDKQMKLTKPHSKEAINLGKQRMLIYKRRHSRMPKEPMPKWMKTLYESIP